MGWSCGERVSLNQTKEEEEEEAALQSERDDRGWFSA